MTREAEAPPTARPSLLLVVAASAGLLLVTAQITRVRAGREALARADVAAERGESRELVVALRSAAQARCPGCAAPSVAFARLEVVAREAETRGDLATARFALAAERSAALTTALASSPERAHAEREIARLARTPSGAGADANVDVGAALADDGLPGAATFALLTAALVLLVLGAARVSSAKRPSVVEAALAAGGIAVGAVALLVF